MGVKVPIEVLSINTYKLIYEIMNALDDYVICPDSRDKYDEQLMERIMAYVHKYIDKERVKDAVKDCVKYMCLSDINQIPYDDSGCFDMNWLSDMHIEELNPISTMLNILWCNVPKPFWSSSSNVRPYILQWFRYVGTSFEEFMCKAIEFRSMYMKTADKELITKYGDAWITKLVSLYENLWKEIYNYE